MTALCIFAIASCLFSLGFAFGAAWAGLREDPREEILRTATYPAPEQRDAA